MFLYPTPELPDNMPIDHVRFATRIRNVLNAAGIKTVGEVRKTSDKTLLSLQDLGQGSVTHLRETLGRDAVAIDTTVVNASATNSNASSICKGVS